jgi:hypothetical protein
MTLGASLGASMFALVILGANQILEFIATFTIVYLIVTYAVRPRRRDKFDIIGFALVVGLAFIVLSAALAPFV